MANADLEALPLERLEAEISGWNAQLSAATCRWLLLVGEFDRRRGWEAWECHNCAHYLDWMCGNDRRTAREHVRVARSLQDLPVTSGAFARGELSYAKVRAITRVATRQADALVGLAEAAVAGGAEGLAAHVPDVVVHVDVAVLSDDADGDCLLDDGPALAPETARRLACDAGIVPLIEDADGTPSMSAAVLDAGRALLIVPEASTPYGPFKLAVVQPVWLWAGWVTAIGTKLTAPERG